MRVSYPWKLQNALSARDVLKIVVRDHELNLLTLNRYCYSEQCSGKDLTDLIETLNGKLKELVRGLSHHISEYQMKLGKCLTSRSFSWVLSRANASNLIIYALSQGTKRYSQLQQQIKGIWPKMLIQNLRKLEACGLVQWVVHPQVDYFLYTVRWNTCWSLSGTLRVGYQPRSWIRTCQKTQER